MILILKIYLNLILLKKAFLHDLSKPKKKYLVKVNISKKIKNFMKNPFIIFKIFLIKLAWFESLIFKTKYKKSYEPLIFVFQKK